MTPRTHKEKITISLDPDVLDAIIRESGDNRSGFINNLVRAILLPEHDWRKFEVIHARIGHDRLKSNIDGKDSTKFHTLKHIFHEAIEERFKRD